MEKRNETRCPLHPGTVLARELEERGISQVKFAHMAGISTSNLSEFINGKRRLNSNWAFKFEETLGVSYQFWMNIQNGYDYKMKSYGRENVCPDADMATLSSRVPPRLKEQITLLAERAGMSVSTFIRQTMEKAVAGML